MALDTFTPPISPSVGLTDTPEIKVLRASFGDGYSQATIDGLNHIRSIRDLTWEVLTLEQRNEIINFFVSKRGCDPFRWQLAHDPQPLKFVCVKWSETMIAGKFYRVTAQFRQDFNFS